MGSGGIRWNMSFQWIPTESEWNMLESAGICQNMSFRQIPRAIPADSHILADSEGHSGRFRGLFQQILTFRQIPRAIPADSKGHSSRFQHSGRFQGPFRQIPTFQQIPRAIPADSQGHSSRFIYNFIDTAISVSHVILNVTLRDQVTLLILCIHFIYVILNTKSILPI
jgi:hypothetical protein